MGVLTKGYSRLYFADMAKQAGNIFIEGTIDELTFYKMDGVHYIRMKSCLTGKRFWKHKAFEGSRKSCARFGEGNKLASKIYRMIEEEKRSYKLFCFLKTRAIQLIKEGKSLLQAEEILMDYVRSFGYIEDGEEETIVIESSYHLIPVIQLVFTVALYHAMTKWVESG